jgi:hypothetical protein
MEEWRSKGVYIYWLSVSINIIFGEGNGRWPLWFRWPGWPELCHGLLVMYFSTFAADIFLCSVIHFYIAFFVVECILALRCYIIAIVKTITPCRPLFDCVSNNLPQVVSERVIPQQVNDLLLLSPEIWSGYHPGMERFTYCIKGNCSEEAITENLQHMWQQL